MWAARTAAAIALFALAAPHVAAASVVLNFDSLDASGGGVSGAPLDAYLASFGVSEIATSSDYFVVVQGSDFTPAVSPPNIMGMIVPGTGGSVPLDFANPIDSVSFTRTAIVSTTPNGASIGEWSATAYSGATPVASVGEGLQTTFGTIPAKMFSLTAADITSVVFYSNVEDFAGTNLVFDDLTLDPSPLPEPSSAGLLAAALAGFAWLGRRGAGVKKASTAG